eukprot:NODE_2_length_91304_cov_0.692462.p11 type:complete len:555 gc:universal NODE_2_length_91304_cov_0.692462:45634-47298(+)
MATSLSLNTICSICSHTVQFKAKTSCEHEMCSVCAIRMRLLFKQENCVFCKQPIQYLIVGNDPQKKAFPFAHLKWQIYYTSVDAYYHVMNLLRFHCPICEKQWNSYLYFTAASENQEIQNYAVEQIKYTSKTYSSFKELATHLKSHTDEVPSGYKFCDICVKDAKRFVRELNIYPSNLISKHTNTGDKQFLQSNVEDHREKDFKVSITEKKNVLNPLINFAGHPLCQFCTNRFVDQEQLKKHMKERHEECSLCKQSGKSIWFNALKDLQAHYKEDHIVCEYCTTSEGLIGFADDLDYINHLASKHNITNKIRIGQKPKTLKNAQTSQEVLPVALEPIERQLRQTSIATSVNVNKIIDCHCSRNCDLKIICSLFHHDRRLQVFRDFLIELSPLEPSQIYDELFKLQPRLFTYPELTNLIQWFICTSPVSFRIQLRDGWKPWYEQNCKFPDLAIADCVVRFVVVEHAKPKNQPSGPRSMLHMVNRAQHNSQSKSSIYLPWLWTDAPLGSKSESTIDISIPTRSIPLSSTEAPNTSQDRPRKQKQSGRKKQVLMKMG